MPATVATGRAGGYCRGVGNSTHDPTPARAVNPLPRWRGFNLPEMFLGPYDLRFADMIRSPRGRFAEDDLRWIADWGFDFVRLPLCYHWWTPDRARPSEIDERALAPIDAAIELAGRLGLHLSLCLHHAPGFCINPAPWPEPFDLWKDAAAVECFAHHWGFIARRYAHVPVATLDFDLLNEPTGVDGRGYASAVAPAIRAIRAAGPADRWIISDGLDAGNTPCLDLLAMRDPRIAQSCRGYKPTPVTHYLAWWAGNTYVKPAWPQPEPAGRVFGPEELSASFDPWRDLLSRGVGVHCGEFGCWNRTPHRVALAWMECLLSILAQMNVGWALWNFRGSFGVIDSARSDVDYADWHGLPLDRSMLDLLRRG